MSYRLAKARHRLRKRRQRGAPIVVFAMAKSGTTAVAAALQAAQAGPVFQVHDLDPAFLSEEERQYQRGRRPWRNWDAQCLLDRPPAPEQPWRVVSLVRDPIAQSVSAFFQPGEWRGYLDSTTTVDHLVERFGDRLDRLPLRWFESHLEPALGIDVYASAFDPARGYAIITTPTVRLLLLRCEGLGVAPRALGELVGSDSDIPVPRLNVGSEKSYGDLYSQFLRSMHPSPAVLERAYGSRMVTHFYSPDEIARFRAFWSGHDGAGAAPSLPSEDTEQAR